MGCDIHMFAEKKVKSSMTIYSNDKKKVKTSEFWLKLGKIFTNPYFEPLDPISDYNEITTDEPYGDRNYTLFAFLADVRNRHEIKPLRKPRGLPKDLSDEVKKEAEDWNGDGHSHSYFTLEELDKVDWHKTYVKQSGLVDPENYKIFKKTGRPQEWCQGTTAKNYKEVSWFVSLSEFCDDFVYKTLPTLRNYARRNEIPYDKIRLVFWFDN